MNKGWIIEREMLMKRRLLAMKVDEMILEKAGGRRQRLREVNASGEVTTKARIG